MVHRTPDRADEQRKEAEIVPLLTPPRSIWIDWSTGEICTPEPIEHGAQVIPFTAPRRGLRRKSSSMAIASATCTTEQAPWANVSTMVSKALRCQHSSASADSFAT